MKILFTADVPLEDPTSGSEQVLHQEAKGLAQMGMDVYAITRQEVHPARTIRSVTGVTEGTYGASVRNMNRALLALAIYPPKLYNRFIKDAPFKAVICHQPFNYIALLFRRNIHGLPMLYVFHSPSHEEYLISHESRTPLRLLPQVFVRRVLERFCLKKARRIMVLSEYMKRKVIDIHKIPGRKIFINPGGVDLERFKPSPNREFIKRRLGFPEASVHLLTVRNLEPRMGIENLIRCMGLLREERTKIHLILCGDGVERENIRKLVASSDLDDRVTMTGFIPSQRLPQYYMAADFFVLPTRRLEGFGLVTPESMACGTPVLGTPVGGTKEILSPFDPRFLFRDTSPEAMEKGIRWAVSEYFDQKKKYDLLRIACREYAEKHYSWERHTDRLRSVLSDEMHLLPIN